MADETIIVEVILETKNQIENATRLRTAIDELKATQDALRKNGEANTVQFEANAAALRDLQTQYRQTTKDIDNTNKQIQAETGSIAANRAELARLTAEYIKSAKPTGEQTARIKALSDRLKEQEKAVGDTRRNVGNYGDALKGLGATLPGVGKGMDTFNKISAANPLGLIIIAVTTLINSFKSFQPVLDGLAKAGSVFNNVFDVVLNTLTKIGSGLVQVLSGNFAEGFNTIGNAVAGVGDQFAQAAAEGIRYADALKEIEDLNARNAVFFAQQEKQIAVLSRSLRDRTKSEQDRLKIADEITRVENQRFNREKEIADLNAKNERIALGNALLRKGVTLEEIKNTEDIVKLAQDRAVSDDLINKYVEARVQSINKETESETRLEAIQVRRNQILEAGEAKRQKDREEAAKQREKDIADRARALEKEIADAAKTADEFSKIQDKQIKEARDKRQFEEEAQLQLDEIFKSEKEADLLEDLKFEQFIEEEKTRFAAEESAKRKALRQAEFESVVELANALSGLAASVAMNSKKDAELQKSIAIFNIAVSTAEAIAKGVASSQDVPFPGNLISTATTVATVLANIARANAILNTAPQFYEGGYTGDGNPHEESKALGRKPYIYHKAEYVVPHKLLNEPVIASFIDSVVEPKRKGIAPSGMTGMFDGGFATTAVRNEVSAGLQSNQLEKAFSKMRPVVRVSEINTVQNKVSVLDNMSTL